MKVLFVNPILYTPENAQIPKVNSIEDTMACSLCRAFERKGIDVTLAAASEWKPLHDPICSYKIIWLKSYFKKFFPIHRIPVNLGLINTLLSNSYDAVISSEVFSIDTLICVIFARKKTIIWHEMAKHNRMGKGLLSRFWYNVIARTFMRGIPVIARSAQARQFISKYCNNVSPTIIEHGVDFDIFSLAQGKTDTFCVVSQLIKRKRIDKIIIAFSRYHYSINQSCKLYIIGSGPEKESLIQLTSKLGIANVVSFMGQLNHLKLQHYLSEAKAMLVYTEKDNSMISIVESIASGTPVVTTSVPLNSSYIRMYSLGVVNDNWDESDLRNIDSNLNFYVSNCCQYRKAMSTDYKVNQFINCIETELRI
ncbi:glycosyltransferase family 4 protein [Collinsella tanakaei]|uniref:glycosyltransferase family 4 protein n=1 Tax=Collinsella tanakaei TaxID=626935 RepID=UPI00195E0363|nr:glycosyltransferase [Collinsella tanakaei]MBM6868106.1 glycosyltransferase [Collinsella tanakaei]